MRRYRVGLLAIFLVPLLAAAARAEPSVAVLGLEPIDVPEALAQQLTDALRQRAAGTLGIKAVAGKDLIEIKMVFGCDSENPACMANAGRTLGADKLLYGTLKKAGGKSSPQVVVSLKLLDVRSASVEKFISTTVNKRELAAGAVNQSAARWFGDLVEVAKPMLTITSDPTGATVTVDGGAMGRTPVTLRELNAGSHLVTVTMPGRLPFTRTVELRPGGTHEVVAQLEAEKVAVVTPPPPPVNIAPPQPDHVPPPPITQPPPPPARVGHPGLTAKILAGVAVGGAVITGSVAIYTWRTYSDLEDTAHKDLTMLPAPTNAAQSSFFKSPDCSATSIAASSALNTYKGHCSSGQTYANATTALWVVTGTLAAAGVVSFIIGDRQSRKAHERAPTTAQIIKQTLTLEPVFSTQTGGVQAAFEF
jgi:PEGA domain